MRSSRGTNFLRAPGYYIPAWNFRLGIAVLFLSLFLSWDIKAEEITDPELTNAIAFARSQLKATQPKLMREELQRQAEAIGRSNYLFRAISDTYGRGDTNKGAVLLKQFPGSVDVLQAYGEPLLIRAVRQGDLELLKLLAERKADLNRGSWDQEPPLSVAIQNSQWEMAKALVEAGASLTSTNREGTTSMGLIVNNFSAGRPDTDAKLELLQKMLAHGADSFLSQGGSRSRRSVVEHALMWGGGAVGDILLTNRVSVARRTPDGDTALHLAAYWGKTNAMQFLLNAGFNINQTNDSGLSPLQVLAGLAQKEPPSNARYSVITTTTGRRRTTGANVEELLARGATLDVWSAAGLGMTNELAAMLAADPGLVKARDGVGRTPLHYAAFTGNTAAAAKLIAAGADPMAETSKEIWRLPEEKPLASKITPLHLASMRGTGGMIELLLKAGAKAGAVEAAGNTPLHLAGGNYETNVTSLLILSGAPKDALNAEGKSALRLAVESGNIRAMEILLKSGARPEAGMSTNTLLHIAVMTGQTGSIELLLRHGLKVDVRDKEGNTPFMVSVTARQWPTMVLLEKKGANVNAVNLKGDSALHRHMTDYQDMIGHQVDKTWLDKLEWDWLARPGFRRNVMTNLIGRKWLSPPAGIGWTNTSMTGWLVEKGADPELENVDGNTPLHLLAGASQLRFSGNFSTRQITNLFKGGAKIESRNKAGLTSLHIAVTNAPPVYVAAWIPTGLKLDELKDASGRTPLHMAVMSRDYALTNTSLLLSKGANPNVRDLAGQTPLHVIVTNHNSQALFLVKALLQSKADPNVRDNLGRTPLHLAMEWNNNNPFFYQTSQTLEELVKAGADGSLVDNEGQTFLHRWASQGPHYSGNMDRLVQQLFSSNPKLVNMTNKVGDTPLHIAIRSNDYSRVMTLRNANADLTLKNVQGDTPLYLACVSSRFGLDQQIRPKGATIGFFQALMNHEKRSIDAWLEAEPKLASATNAQGKTALMIATERPPYDFAKKLLAMGAQMDLLSGLRMGDMENVELLLRRTTNISKEILFEGIRLKRFEVIKEAAQKHGDLRALDWEGHTLLYRALSKEQSETASWLKEQGVITTFLDAVALGDTNQMAGFLETNRSLANGTNAFGHTMLMRATKAGKAESVKMLIAYGARLNETIERGWTALHVAPSSDAGEATEELLKAGTDPNSLDSNGLTPLHLAAINGATNVMKVLLKHGVKVNQTQAASDEEQNGLMPKGATALHWAANRGRLAAVKLLLANGVDVNATNTAGETALDLVRRDYQVPMYYYLLPNGMSMNPYPGGPHKDLKEMEAVIEQAGGVRKKR